ncbi:MmcQ/YjbR family DNA-binding protein [Limnobaculum zhutongyuii]|uniref:MmcQ/YjbR family DNA-binding protein n=1 Tax=Limnobaculum zhutongyuii TaxID=2498113 RepID=A0A411WH44_9GAMM|nr:MmcQ/YjbR family DNA-binding protein [Limnobaculum zhutongyuii]QBH95542.1 MmcQ/YjbR family DNA-binding protein [Limnobaculum zhutongyuii]TQS88767.1 MmcQ/YjbR family DNA-binding protein [Limnobaculum zhutongyuii]
MNSKDLIPYCLTKLGAVHDYKAEWEADRVCVCDKMFALLGELNGRPIISLKSDPDRSDILRQTFPDIIPGYYLNKRLWNTLFLDGALSMEMIEESIDHSYLLVVQGLPKKTQKMLGIQP